MRADTSESLCLSPPAGVTCLGAEQLNSATHDGGNSTWEWGIAGWSGGNPRYDMDDSDNSHEISLRLYPIADNFCQNSPGMQPVTAASESAFLPAGNALSYVMRHRGYGNACAINHPPVTFNKTTGSTFCIRHYRRWDQTSQMPGPIAGSPSGEPQQKVQSIGAYANTAINENVVRHQFSITPETEGITGSIGWSADFPLAGLATGSAVNMGYADQDCDGNYCRFESCIDYSTSGNVHFRARMTEVSPGTGEVHLRSSTDGAGHDGNMAATWSLVGVDSATGTVFYGQDVPDIVDYASHFIAMQVDHEDQTFWPGPAVEFEGGTGNPGLMSGDNLFKGKFIFKTQ